MKKKENKKGESLEQRAKGKGQRAEKKVQSSKFKVQSAGSRGRGAISQFPAASKISTVYNIKKPSATETWFPAEGCISEPQAIRACLMIRVFNN